MSQIPYDHWQPISLEETVALFNGAPCTWAVAGGHAIDLFIGQKTRSHTDIDIIIFRDEQHTLQQWLTPSWLLYAADTPSTLRPWQPGEFLQSEINNLWTHRITSTAWELQLMLMDGDTDTWTYRREPAIYAPRAQILAEHNGIPYLRPEIQLLYKSKQPRPKDYHDFSRSLSQLKPHARMWLQSALETAYPDGHNWLNMLIEKS